MAVAVPVVMERERGVTQREGGREGGREGEGGRGYSDPCRDWSLLSQPKREVHSSTCPVCPPPAASQLHPLNGAVLFTARRGEGRGEEGGRERIINRQQ